METVKQIKIQPHAAIDITKLIMAYMVIAIHTEPFGYSYWLDKGIGILTRFCVPFFFLTSSYFFFCKNGSALHYIKRLFLLYLIWSIIYLPFDFNTLSQMSVKEVLLKYFWIGNGHALWYLCGSLVAFFIVYGLSKILEPKKILIISIIFLIVGTIKSTYAPLFESIFGFAVKDFWGSRNGLFYGFAYYALGLYVARRDMQIEKVRKLYIVRFIISFVVLIIETLIFGYIFNTESTILWLSVMPLTYNFFMIIKSINISIKKTTSIFIRKCSTMIYVVHCLFMYLLPNLNYYILFIIVAILSTITSVFIVYLSNKKNFEWLKVLY